MDGWMDGWMEDFSAIYIYDIAGVSLVYMYV